LPVDPWHIAVGAGSVWVTPNGADGRLIRINPRTRRISARISAHPIYFGSVLAFGAGCVWTGNDDERYQGGATVSKLNPRTNRVVGNPLVLGSPQSIAFGQGALWVADAHGSRLLEADPETTAIRRIRRLPVGPIYPAVGAGSIWSGSAAVWQDETAQDDQVVRIDPTTLVIAKRFPVGGNVSAVAFGFRSLWAALQTGQVVRITPKPSA
jgi:DNA-binding beta-propeller fold protein YncE